MWKPFHVRFGGNCSVCGLALAMGHGVYQESSALNGRTWCSIVSLTKMWYVVIIPSVVWWKLFHAWFGGICSVCGSVLTMRHGKCMTSVGEVDTCVSNELRLLWSYYQWTEGHYYRLIHCTVVGGETVYLIHITCNILHVLLFMWLWLSCRTLHGWVLLYRCC